MLAATSNDGQPLATRLKLDACCTYLGDVKRFSCSFVSVGCQLILAVCVGVDEPAAPLVEPCWLCWTGQVVKYMPQHFALLLALLTFC